VLLSGERTSFFLLLITICLLIILIKNLRKALLYGLLFFVFLNLIFSFFIKNPFDRMFKYTFSQVVTQKIFLKQNEKFNNAEINEKNNLESHNTKLSNLEVNNKSYLLSNYYIFIQSLTYLWMNISSKLTFTNSNLSMDNYLNF
jgi:hypothetical protein